MKEDWWVFDENKKPIAPRHELIREFFHFSSGNFWMYDINSFLFKSKSYIDSRIEENVIKEIKNVTSKYFLDQNLLCNWLFEQFSAKEIILCDGVDLGLDYLLPHDNGENVGIIHTQIRSQLYTKLLFPIKAAFDNYEKLKIENNLSELIIIIEYPNFDLAINYLEHFKRKTLRNLIDRCENSLRIIVATNNNDVLEIVYDSKDNNGLKFIFNKLL